MKHLTADAVAVVELVELGEDLKVVVVNNSKVSYNNSPGKVYTYSIRLCYINTRPMVKIHTTTAYYIMGGDYMCKQIKITEIKNDIQVCNTTLMDNELIITNTSGLTLNNIKISLEGKDYSILSQSIIRERGTFNFPPYQNCLEVGNLAPEESAYFKYTCSSINNLVSLAGNLILTYNLEDDSNNIRYHVSELIK